MSPLCGECGKPGRPAFAGSVLTTVHIRPTDHAFRVATPRSGLDNAVAPIAAVPSSRPAHVAGTLLAPGEDRTT